MIKIDVIKVVQHNEIRYVGAIDARKLVRLATKVEFKKVQDAQRPLTPKKLEEISIYVATGGTISTSIVIGTTNGNLNVKKDEETNRYYIEFPETEAEFLKFQNSFDIMDGQHRLFSFLSEYVKIPDDECFDITFEMYIKPTMKAKRLIFKNTNEKQESVAPNLLMWFRARLGMLTNKEEKYHGLVSLMNTETCSPLKNRIIMGAERITGGFKASQIINILDKYNIKDIGNRELSDEKALTVISQYLNAWEEAVGTTIIDRNQKYGAFSKISGFRFMMLMLPEFYNQAVNDKQKFSKKYILKKIQCLFANEGMEAKDLFDKNSDYIKRLGNNPFSGETPITLLAKEWNNSLRNLSSIDFDPLEEI
ncbi:MAG: DGQHR domain-containing protein [Bacillota bacterium]|nr:DGQHR domain-containing protein [Bacillota bacterium]